MSTGTGVTLVYRCPDRSCRSRNTASLGPETTVHRCLACGMETTIQADPALAAGGNIVKCAVCDGREFFIRKDFPQKVGLALVVVFGLIASVFYYYERIPATFVVLGSLVLIDAAIYFVVGKVTVCYRCRAEYRGIAYNPEHTGFDLATSEKYDP